MSYNNFSYFNGPTNPTQWWAPNNPNNPNNAKKPVFENNLVPVTVKPHVSNPWSKTIMTSEYGTSNFSQTQGLAQSMILPSESRPVEPPAPQHEVIQGTVTKLFANFGYIDDSIIFSKADVLGQMVQVGDKVAVDATYQPNNPTKYKGERVYKVDEARFNSVVNSSGKMKTLTQALSTRIELPAHSRSDRKRDSRDRSPRNESSIKSRIDYSYDNRALSPKWESSIKSRLDVKYDTRDPSPRTESSVKSRLDYKYDSRELSPRYNYRYETRKSSPRTDSSSKNRPDYKYESSKRSNRRSTSSKRNSESSSSKYTIKDRLSIDKEKVKHRISITDDRKERKKMEQSSKEELPKHKPISPIKYHSPPKDSQVSSLKRKSESKIKSSKTYENFANYEMDCAAVKNLYRSLSLPKEFFHISLKYQTSFPLNHPMKLGNNCHFKVMDKKVKSIDPFVDEQLRREIDPKDADTTFVAKVMLLSTEDLAKFYKDTLTLAEEFEGENKVPITKAITFLVSSVGPGKEFAIGGAWSPSLDGTDPETNPRVLINTAIRTCKAITGIDLSNCSSWPKFLELHYYRPPQKIQKNDDSNKVTDVENANEGSEYMNEPRMETVVYYMPDVWNCVPSTDSWNEITRLYQEQLACIMCPPPVTMKPVNNTPPPTIAESTTETSTRTIEQITTTAKDPDDNSNQTDNDTKTKEEDKSPNNGNQDEEDWNFNETEEVDDKAKNSDMAVVGDAELPVPTHFSKLLVASLKIVEIKKELELRKLNNRGVMEQLKARLKAALEREEMEEKNKDTAYVDTSPVSPTVAPVPVTTLTESEKSELRKHYTLPDRPTIIVHQNRKMFANQSKIRTMSLHSLLSYHNATLPENTFELALFARQFNDMLKRDAIFNVYKSIVMANEDDLCNNDESAKKSKLMVTTAKRTINRPLLFSCTLLDKERTNKISLEDLKVMIESLGICLTTNQLSAVLDKVKDSSKYFYYRQLTDKEMTDADIANILTLNASEDLDYIKELAMGNKALFESDITPTDSSMNDDEMERLKNELDRSERCRQSTELKVAEMKDETEKNIKLVQIYLKEIMKLKEQLAEYRTKYHDEQDRSEFYKRDFERMLRYMREVDNMTLSINQFVVESLQKYEPKKPVKEDVKENIDGENETEQSLNEEVVVVDIMDEENHVSIEMSNDADMLDIVEPALTEENTVATIEHKEETVQEQRESVATKAPPTIAVHSSMEDFDLSKPSDYDMIIIDETE